MKSYFVSAGFILFLVTSLISSCKKDVAQDPVSAYEDGEEYSGGKNITVFDATSFAFNHSLPILSDSDETKFSVGNSFNRNNWVIAPSSTVGRDGLGPLYNALSCSGCHNLDGRGQPPLPGEATISMVYKLSSPGTGIHGEPLGVTNFGDQLNNRAIPGVTTEGDVNISYIEVPGSYPDGTTYSLRQPTYTFQNSALNGVMYSPRVAPKMTGTGLMDAIAEGTILANADENDANGDGISGRPNYVWDYVKNTTALGRIGWKAGQPSVKQQVAHAFSNDIGITSSLFPDENLSGTEVGLYASLPNGGTPEISDDIFNQVYFYTSTLAMPGRRDFKDADVLLGKTLFTQTGCVKCHVPKMQTGTHPDVAYLNNQTIFMYSDLLLHDMGSGLADGRPEFNATGNEWRTAPLWGVGLIKAVNNHEFLLHDGRARGVEEAILWHGGEAISIKTNFTKLSKDDRARLIKFVESL